MEPESSCQELWQLCYTVACVLLGSSSPQLIHPFADTVSLQIEFSERRSLLVGDSCWWGILAGGGFLLVGDSCWWEILAGGGFCEILPSVSP
jgi:hypothetical protein